MAHPVGANLSIQFENPRAGAVDTPTAVDFPVATVNTTACEDAFASRVAAARIANRTVQDAVQAADKKVARAVSNGESAKVVAAALNQRADALAAFASLVPLSETDIAKVIAATRALPTPSSLPSDHEQARSVGNDERVVVARANLKAANRAVQVADSDVARAVANDFDIGTWSKAGFSKSVSAALGKRVDARAALARAYKAADDAVADAFNKPRVAILAHASHEANSAVANCSSFAATFAREAAAAPTALGLTAFPEGVLQATVATSPEVVSQSMDNFEVEGVFPSAGTQPGAQIVPTSPEVMPQVIGASENGANHVAALYSEQDIPAPLEVVPQVMGANGDDANHLAALPGTQIVTTPLEVVPQDMGASEVVVAVNADAQMHSVDGVDENQAPVEAPKLPDASTAKSDDLRKKAVSGKKTGAQNPDYKKKKVVTKVVTEFTDFS